MGNLKLKDISKSYDGEKLVVENFNMDINDGEFIVLVGPSGCGKSTVLRMIAGLEEITGGELVMGDKVVNDEEPKNRDIAMVFQDYALYPHMTVGQNMGYGLKVRKIPKNKINEKVVDSAGILGLKELLQRKPGELSGGQRQRVALGRSIVRDADFFLMDEPLSNLDAKLRVQMRYEISELQNRLGVTTIYVTHDQTEAMTMADRIVVMNEGKVQQIGSPLEVYNKPANIFVGTFMGSPALNILDAYIGSEGVHLSNDTLIHLDKDILEKLSEKEYMNKNLKIGIRPEHFAISKDGDKDSLRILTRHTELFGRETVLYGALTSNEQISLIVDPEVEYQMRKEILVSVRKDKIHFFDNNTGNRIITE